MMIHSPTSSNHSADGDLPKLPAYPMLEVSASNGLLCNANVRRPNDSISGRAITKANHHLEPAEPNIAYVTQNGGKDGWNHNSSSATSSASPQLNHYHHGNPSSLQHSRVHKQQNDYTGNGPIANYFTGPWSPVQHPCEYPSTSYQRFNQPFYNPVLDGQLADQTKRLPTHTTDTRFIRPVLSDHFGAVEPPLYPSQRESVPNINSNDIFKSQSFVDELAAQLTNNVTVSSPITSNSNGIWSNAAKTASIPSSTLYADMDDSDSEEDDGLSHPNKFPVEIEDHDNKSCVYRRQPTRSGLKVKQIKNSVYDPLMVQHRVETQQIKYYQKDLVRICRCGKYAQMDGALIHGRANDCDGYEIHYSQKCKWKAYDDFKTGKRVLIRLCKCYKPT